MKFADFKIQTKLMALVGVLSTVILVISISSMFFFHLLATNSDRVLQSSEEALLGEMMEKNIIALSRAEFQIAADPEARVVHEMEEVVEKNERLFREHLNEVEALANEKEMVILKKVEEEYKIYVENVRNTIDMAKKYGSDVHLNKAQSEIYYAVKESEKSADTLEHTTDEYIKMMRKLAHDIEEEIHHETTLAYILSIVISVGGLVGGGVFGYLLASRGIGVPLKKIIGNICILANGDTSVSIFGTDRKDDIGEIAIALDVFRNNLVKANTLAEEQKTTQIIQVKRGEKLEVITKGFEGKISNLVKVLSSATVELDTTAQSMASIAEETASQSSSMSTASQSTSENIQGVASASEELSSSIKELNTQVSISSTATRSVVEDVEKASEQIEGLSIAVDKIGAVVTLIQNIAEQTNLLALNATIESARAGDAGKGFAVVAGEVKNLAGQTAQATEQISQQIESVQRETKGAVEAIKGISKKISDVNEISASIMAAIEEQGVSTEEISRNTQVSATNMKELNTNVGNVNVASKDTGIAAEKVLGSSKALSQQSADLEQEVKDFLSQVKSA